MLPCKLFDVGITGCEWTQRCISCSIQMDMSVTNHAQMFFRGCAEAINNSVSVRIETHHFRLLCINSEQLSLCVRSHFVQHGLRVVGAIGWT